MQSLNHKALSTYSQYILSRLAFAKHHAKAHVSFPSLLRFFVGSKQFLLMLRPRLKTSNVTMRSSLALQILDSSVEF